MMPIGIMVLIRVISCCEGSVRHQISLHGPASFEPAHTVGVQYAVQQTGADHSILGDHPMGIRLQLGGQCT